MIADLIFILSYYGILLWIRYRWKNENIEFKKVKPVMFITPILYFCQNRKGKRRNESIEIGLMIYELWCHIMTIVLIIDMVAPNSFLDNMNSLQRVLLLCSGVIWTIIYELIAWIHKKVK